MGYVDYENIRELLKTYGKNPLEIDFFRVILGRLAIAGLKVIDFIVYGDFEKTMRCNDQTFLRAMGLQTRHATNDGKSSGDLELTVDALRDLYKNSNISIFVIISSDRDIIPLLKAIKYENKLSYVYSTRNGFNQIVAKYADFHEYLEDLFTLTPGDQVTINSNEIDSFNSIDPATVSPEKIRRAKEVCQYFYTSHIWTKSSILGKPVCMKGYSDVVAKVVQRPVEEVLEDFKLAHALKYVTLYSDPGKGLCIKEGERFGEVNKLQAQDLKKGKR
jgi:hypothetical protein